MREAAADLDFEEAARLRDEIKRLRADRAGGGRQSDREISLSPLAGRGSG